jgi:regulator of protease activity HflC (stomatin/prohibitin superfamily)
VRPGTDLVSIIVIVVLVLAAAALMKHLFSVKPRQEGRVTTYCFSRPI